MPEQILSRGFMKNNPSTSGGHPQALNPQRGNNLAPANSQ